MKRLMGILSLAACTGAEETGPPQITVDWSPVTLGVVGVPMKETFHFDMQFTNIGGELLTLESVTVKGDYRCSFEFDGPDVTDIATTESAFIRGYYSPPSEGEDRDLDRGDFEREGLPGLRRVDLRPGRAWRRGRGHRGTGVPGPRSQRGELREERDAPVGRSQRGGFRWRFPLLPLGTRGADGRPLPRMCAIRTPWADLIPQHASRVAVRGPPSRT